MLYLGLTSLKTKTNNNKFLICIERKKSEFITFVFLEHNKIKVNYNIFRNNSVSFHLILCFTNLFCYFQQSKIKMQLILDRKSWGTAPLIFGLNLSLPPSQHGTHHMAYTVGIFYPSSHCQKLCLNFKNYYLNHFFGVFLKCQ